jgi:hypothetical protein
LYRRRITATNIIVGRGHCVGNRGAALRPATGLLQLQQLCIIIVITTTIIIIIINIAACNRLMAADQQTTATSLPQLQ